MLKCELIFLKIELLSRSVLLVRGIIHIWQERNIQNCHQNATKKQALCFMNTSSEED
jgi:hypothetical protein